MPPGKIKATKWQILEFIHEHGFVEIWQLCEEFDYTPGHTKNRLTDLKKRLGMVTNCRRGQWELTDYGLRRLNNHNGEENRQTENRGN